MRFRKFSHYYRWTNNILLAIPEVFIQLGLKLIPGAGLVKSIAEIFGWLSNNKKLFFLKILLWSSPVFSLYNNY